MPNQTVLRYWLVSYHICHMYFQTIFTGVGAADSDLFLPWFQTKRPLVSGDVFSQFLSTTAMSRMVIFNAKHRSIQCDFININNPLVIEYARLYN